MSSSPVRQARRGAFKGLVYLCKRFCIYQSLSKSVCVKPRCDRSVVGMFSWAPCRDNSSLLHDYHMLWRLRGVLGVGGSWAGVRGSHPCGDSSHTSSSPVIAHNKPPIEQRWLRSRGVGRSQFVCDRWALNNNSGRSYGQFGDWCWSSCKNHGAVCSSWCQSEQHPLCLNGGRVGKQDTICAGGA